MYVCNWAEQRWVKVDGNAIPLKIHYFLAVDRYDLVFIHLVWVIRYLYRVCGFVHQTFLDIGDHVGCGGCPSPRMDLGAFRCVGSDARQSDTL